MNAHEAALRRSLLLLPLLAGAAFGASAEDLFTSTLQPILERDCEGCHGATQAFSKFDVRTREAMLKGGVRGPALEPGRAGESLLIHVLEGRNKLQMPPGGELKKLAPEIIAAFREWVEAGAPWPEKKAATKWQYKEADLWAFQPLRAFDKHRRIDGFVDARLKAAGLTAAPEASRQTLVRRVTIDLTGLPPTPEEAEAFIQDRSPRAWETLVDRLLASPRYGERWGRHWLDVARYADTSGYSNDFERPNAWRYRDYVIRSFNQDKPYDRFILEQIAGDELFPDDAEALIATGFLRGGPWEHTGMAVEAVTRQLFLDDVTHNTAATFLGLSVGCARCHDHKFDPIPTKDYYRLQAVFATTEFARPALPFLKSENTSDLAGGDAHIRKAIAQVQTKLAEFRGQSARALMKSRGLTRVEDLPEKEIERAMVNGVGLEPEEFEAFKLFRKHLELHTESLDRFQPKAFAVSSGPLNGFTDGGNSLKYPQREDYKMQPVHILPGGNIQSPGERVTPGLLTALETYGQYPAPAVPETLTGRRAALAQWIANPRNPLTARVMVNRIWQYHFGQGLAGDTSNFGKMGKKPTHPELLDHLANAFIAGEWSVKEVHRAILSSKAYRRASAPANDQAMREKDPDNTLLSYFAPRRIEAEVIRDSVLSVTGELSFEAGGPGVFPQINETVARQPQHRMGSVAPAYHASALKRQRNRRTIYTFQQRSLIDPMVAVFNGPSLDLPCERRESSTVPTQAFALFNSAFLHDMSLAFAARLERQSSDVPGRIRQAFRQAFGREPDARELASALRHVEEMTALHRASPVAAKPERQPIVHQITSELTGESFSFVQQEDPAAYEENLHPAEVKPETRALADLALVLLNSNEFVYLY